MKRTPPQRWQFILIGCLLPLVVMAQEWQIQPSGTTTPLNAVKFVDGNNGLAVGNNGTILRTTNGGSIWTTQTVGTSNLRALSMVSLTDGWIAGDGGTLLHTTNSGTSWITVASGITVPLQAISFVSTTLGWCAGSGGLIRKTTNGGATWTTQTSTTTRSLHSIVFSTANSGWAVGDSGIIVHTTDGGAAWVSQLSGTGANLNAITVLDSLNGWIVGDSSVTMKTIDGGSNWTLQNWGGTSMLYGVSYQNMNSGWAVGDSLILHTTDSGSSWEACVSGRSNRMRGISTPVAGKAWAVGTMGEICYFNGMTMLFPNGGETLYSQSVITIRWTPGTSQNPVNICWNRSATSTWSTIGTNQPNSGSFTYTLPSLLGNLTPRFAVVDASHPSLADTSDATSSLVRSSMSLTNPVGSGYLYVGDTLPIRWTTNLPGTVTILKDDNYPVSAPWDTIVSGIPSTAGVYNWVITPSSLSHRKFRVVSDSINVYATSSWFTIETRRINLWYPNGYEVFDLNGVSLSITPNYATRVQIGFSRHGANLDSVRTLFADTAMMMNGSNNLDWIPTVDDTTSDGRIYVYDLVRHTSVWSAHSFSIITETPQMQLLRPADGDTIFTGVRDTIRWHINYRASVSLYLYTNSGNTSQLLPGGDSVICGPGNCAFIWTPDSNYITTQGWIYISDNINGYSAGNLSSIVIEQGPTLPIHPPRSTTLSALYNGTTVQLSWTPVSQDTAGNTITVSGYRVYGNTVDSYGVFPTGWVLLGTTFPSVLNYSEAATVPKKFYRVTAVRGE